MKKKKKSYSSSTLENLPPKALSEAQQKLLTELSSKEMVVTYGSAGTGKTYIPLAYAAYLYKEKLISNIVLTRPVVGVGKSLGFFPGTIREKMLPWIQPMLNVLQESLSKGEVECMLKNEKIQIVPFEVIRGHTFQDAFVLLDEAQNTSVHEMKAFVTRTGNNSKVVINGDYTQSDVSLNSGLEFVIDTVEDFRNKELQKRVGIVEFTSDDIVRSEMCKLWVKAIERY